MNVLLINPPSNIKNHVLPLGLAYLASYLETKGIAVQVLDAWALDLDTEQTVKAAAENNPDYIGVTIMSPRFNQAQQIIKNLKSRLPNTPICIGGPHVSALPIESLQKIPEADYAVKGEGEITFYELLRALENHSSLEKIKGIVFRDQKQKIITTPDREFIQNLDDLPMPARHHFPLEKYKTHPPYGRKNPYMSVITSRGCPYKCAYCSKEVFGNRLRMMSASKVVDEIDYLIKKYKVKEIHFYDDDFTMHIKRVHEICDELISRKIKITWSCTTRVDLVNYELLLKMKKAGCWNISYGVESGNQKILDTMQKAIKLERVLKSFAETKKAGIKTLAFFMIGLPGETEDTINESINFAARLNPDFVGWGVLKVFPGSPLYNKILNGEFGGINKIKNISDENYSYHYFFEDNLSYDFLEQSVKKANKKFYLRFSYILKRLLDINSFSLFLHYFKGGIALIKSIFGLSRSY